MANFCNHCASDMRFPLPDIDVYEIMDGLEPSHSIQFGLCEGCGVCGVCKDSSDGTYALVVSNIEAGEALWIPLYEWEDIPPIMIKSSK